MKKVETWNIDGLSGKRSALQALIVNSKPDLQVLSELTVLSMETVPEPWHGASIEATLPSRKNVRSAFRAAMAVILRSGLQYNVFHVYLEQDSTTNSVLQAPSANFV